MEPTYLTLTPTLSAFISAAKTHGLNPYEHLAKYGIEPQKAQINERDFPLTDLIVLLNSACDEVGSYSFLITFVELYEWDKFDSKVLSLVQQDNLYTLTLVFNTLLKEQGSGPELALVQQGKISSYHIKLPTLNNVGNAVYRLVVLIMWDAVMSKLTGDNWKPKKFLVSGSASYKLSKDFTIKGFAVFFDQNHNAIEFDSSLLFQKLSMPVNKNQEMVKSYSEILSNVSTKSLAESVIKMTIHSGDISISHVSSIIGIHPRLLQLKLKKLNTCFSEILTNTRISIAKQQLQSTSYKVHQIACHLAFNSPEAFVRFYRKHEGVTPLQWRKLVNTHYV